MKCSMVLAVVIFLHLPISLHAREDKNESIHLEKDVVCQSPRRDDGQTARRRMTEPPVVNAVAKDLFGP